MDQELSYDVIADSVEAFVWTAKTGTVAAAGKRLGKAPSTLNDRIRALESEIGTLFDRGAAGATWKLTDLGESWLAEAEVMHKTLQRMRGMKSVQRERQVRIAIIQSVEHTIYKPWRRLIHTSHPDIVLELTVETTEIIGDLMKRGVLDAAISMAPHSADDIATRELPPLTMAFIGNAEANKKPNYDFAEIASSLITFQRNSRPWRNVIQLLGATRIGKTQLELSSSIPSMIAAVEENRAIATLPQAIVANTQSTRLRALPCNQDLDPLRIWLSWPKDIGTAHAHAVVESLRTNLA